MPKFGISNSSFLSFKTEYINFKEDEILCDKYHRVSKKKLREFVEILLTRDILFVSRLRFLILLDEKYIT